jgi:hypothetical protein
MRLNLHAAAGGCKGKSFMPRYRYQISRRFLLRQSVTTPDLVGVSNLNLRVVMRVAGQRYQLPPTAAGIRKLHVDGTPAAWSHAGDARVLPRWMMAAGGEQEEREDAFHLNHLDGRRNFVGCEGSGRIVRPDGINSNHDPITRMFSEFVN